MPKSPPTAVYDFRTTFRAPLAFVYRWCTDFSPGDPDLEKAEYGRKILKKGRRKVVYEDLYDTSSGWSWSRHVVDLHPPNRWHSVSTGNYRVWDLNYELRAVSETKTAFHLHGTRTPTGLGVRNPSQAEMGRELRSVWRNFGRALERDYRAGLRSTSTRRR
jgi:hypothetical protein